MNERYLFGIGVVLAMLLVFTAPAAAENRAYFVPQHSSATTGNSTYVTLYVDIDAGIHLSGGQVELKFDPAHADVTRWDKDCQQADNHCWGSLDKNFDFTGNGYMWGGCSNPQYWDVEGGEWASIPDGYFTGPATVKIGRYKVGAVGTPGESPFDFGFEMNPSGCSVCQPCKFNAAGVPLDITWENGTFTHEGFPETFTKPLSTGWNLISLPLTPSDNSVSEVLGGVSYSVVYRYDATSKQFECPSTMDPGIGYFVDVTAASTWEYEGTPVSSTSPGLKSGLNMIGVPNCTMSVNDPDAMGSADYRYVARWNVVDKKFEVYNPNAPVAFHHFDTMEAGEGYFVSAKSDDDTFAISCP